MASSTPKSAFLRGARDGAPFMLVVGPFALLFGVLATEAGLSVAETLGFSVLVIAGASQLAALQQMVEDAPTVIVLATALVVNLRMAMYSASLTPHLGAAPLWKRALISYLMVDQSYAVSISEYERRPEMGLGEKLAYYFGCVTPVFPVWYAMTWVGAVGGTAIPPEFALDFAVPITFIAMFAPLLRTVAHLAAAGASVVLALGLAWLPSGVGLIVAALVAMMVGARVELWMEARRA